MDAEADDTANRIADAPEARTARQPYLDAYLTHELARRLRDRERLAAELAETDAAIQACLAHVRELR